VKAPTFSVFILIAACGGYRKHGQPPAPSCDDADGDGYGVGDLCLGTDCDDDDASAWAEEDCRARCDDDPTLAGCPCDAAEPDVCYSGPAGTSGTGPCRSGVRACERGVWSACEGEALPSDEICDGLDNDCDGTVDDGLTNECGTCGECQEDCVGRDTGCTPWDAEAEGDGVVPCVRGEDDWANDCVTSGSESLRLGVAWFANTNEGTISKVDTDAREETGRYLTSDLGISWTPSPSRTSVDFDGAVVVGNRAFGSQGSVTRVLADDCPDSNGNGRIDTSTGGSDVLDWGDDECIAWNVPVGGWNGIVRAIAVQDRSALDGVREERVWVGLFNERRYVELDREDGSETGEEADVNPCTPYMAAIDADGTLWSSCLSGTLASFDTTDPGSVQTWSEPGSNYGIAIDPSDGRIWLGGSCAVFDPVGEDFTTVPGCNGTVPLPDGEGSVFVGSCWTGGFGASGTCRIDTDTLDVTTISARSYGLDLATDGTVWCVHSAYPTVDVIDPDTEEVETVPLSLASPYTYGDFTGVQLQNIAGGEGEYTHVFEGCGGAGTTWDSIRWDADLPPGTSIEWSVRGADDLASLASASWVALGSAPSLASPADLADLRAGTLELRARLVDAPTGAAPSLYTMGARKTCDLGP
jgi:hypothetical protein